jgi:chromate transporter
MLIFKKGNSMKNNFKLFLIMFKIGLFTFGGGYAMIPLIENEFSTKRDILTHDEFVNMIAIAESTPGPIAINMATYIGYKQGKFFGSLLATIGVVLPSFIIISLISLVLDKFLEYPIVMAAFKGIQVAVVFLILMAGLKMLKKMDKTVFNYIVLPIVMSLVIVFSLFAVRFSTIYYILIVAVISLSIHLITRNRKTKEKGEEK